MLEPLRDLVAAARRPRTAALAIAVAAVALAGCGRDDTGSEVADPSRPAWAPRPLRDVTFERTAARRDRGEYLVNGILQCFMCHSERDWNLPGAPAATGRAGAGAAWWDKPWLVAPNLTSDAETGLARRTDDMIARAIREGVSHDGRRLHPQMWSTSFSGLVDEDLASVVVYLRSLAPIRHPLPTTVLPPEVAAGLDPPAPLPPAPPDLSTPIARGAYLAGIADCAGCHTSWETPRNPGLFGGGNLVPRGGHRAFSSNLTSDSSGIPYYDAALFRQVMRTGALKGRTLSSVMPWAAFRNLTDDDLDALFAYLAAYRPVRHVVDNVNAPAACAICGGRHPLGEYNTPVERRVVSYRIEDFAGAAGAFRLYPAFTLVIEIRNQRLFMRDEGSPRACELTTTDGRLFACDGGIDEIEFTRDAARRVTGLLVNRVDPAVRVR